MIARLLQLYHRYRLQRISASAAIIGKLGGQARARKLREPIRQRAREIRDQLGLGADERLA